MPEVLCVQPKRFILVYNLISSIFMLSLLSLLIFVGGLYTIGKFNMYIIPFSLVCSELVKYTIDNLYFTEVKMVKTRRLVHKFKLKEVATSITLILFMIALYYAIALVFGAQILSNQEETLMFAVLLTTLTVIPACIHLGPNNAIEVLSNLTMDCKFPQFTIMILRNIQFTLAGAWLGAIVIPLDWDRPWQEWPIPCSTGALFGYTIANIFNLILQIK